MDKTGDRREKAAKMGWKWGTGVCWVKWEEFLKLIIIMKNSQRSSKDNVCSICFEREVDSSLQGCSHRFCLSCITSWTNRKRTCPMCRSRIRRILMDSGATIKIKKRDIRPDNFSNMLNPYLLSYQIGGLMQPTFFSSPPIAYGSSSPPIAYGSSSPPIAYGSPSFSSFRPRTYFPYPQYPQYLPFSHAPMNPMMFPFVPFMPMPMPMPEMMAFPPQTGADSPPM